ncbi:hypothetical protein ACNKHT_18140 [Shigella flexneri]
MVAHLRIVTCLTPFPTVGAAVASGTGSVYQPVIVARQPLCVGRRAGITGCAGAGGAVSHHRRGLRYLRQWVNESGIRWGIDDDNVRELELPATGQHTWRFRLTRMLLGYAMESAQGEWQSVLPYDESSGLIAELVGHLASLLMQLNIWRRGLAQERPLEE